MKTERDISVVDLFNTASSGPFRRNAPKIVVQPADMR
jgi:hypothetical protein